MDTQLTTFSCPNCNASLELMGYIDAVQGVSQPPAPTVMPAAVPVPPQTAATAQGTSPADTTVDPAATAPGTPGEPNVDPTTVPPDADAVPTPDVTPTPTS